MNIQDQYTLYKDCVENAAGAAIEELQDQCDITELEAIKLLQIYLNKAV